MPYLIYKRDILKGLFKGLFHAEFQFSFNSSCCLSTPVFVAIKNTSSQEYQLMFPNNSFPQEDMEKMEAREKEQKLQEALKKLFNGLKFFLNRETPRESLAFVIRWVALRVFSLTIMSFFSFFSIFFVFLLGVLVVRCPGISLCALVAHTTWQMRPSHIKLWTDQTSTNSI